MKLNLTTGVLVGALSVFSLSATAGLSSVSFLQAISGQTDPVPVVQNVKDANPGKNLASQYYIRSITGAFDRVTPEAHTDKVSVSESLKLYTNQFENKRAVN